jgi:hypothetical protein
MTEKNPPETQININKKIDFDKIINSVQNLTDEQRLSETLNIVEGIPRFVFDSESPALVRSQVDSGLGSVIEVKNADGSSLWSEKTGFSPESKQQYIDSYEKVASQADVEVKKLLENSNSTLPELLAFSYNSYLDMVDSIVNKYSLSPGHDAKHLSRDMIATIDVFNDANSKSLIAHPSDLLVSGIGALHDNSVGIIPRYQDFKQLATHADVGGIMANKLFTELLPNSPNLCKLITYSIISHTHILKSRECKGKVVLPCLDELVTIDKGLLGFALWGARGGDRSDLSGVTHFGRHIVAILDAEGEGNKDLNPDGTLMSFGEARANLFVLDPNLKGSLISHLLGFANSGLKISPYSINDSKSLIGEKINKRSQQGLEIVKICQDTMSTNESEIPAGVDSAQTLNKLKQVISKINQYPNPDRQSSIEAMIDKLWSETVIKPIEVYTWDKIIDYVDSTYQVELANIDKLDKEDKVFGKVYSRLSKILHSTYSSSFN